MASLTAVISNNFDGHLVSPHAVFEDDLAEEDQLFQEQLSDARIRFDQCLASIKQQHMAELADPDTRQICELAGFQADHDRDVNSLHEGYDKKLEEMWTIYKNYKSSKPASLSRDRA